ncbi:MAG: chromosome segregation protein SMC [Ignavibacteria bacterium GWF2_33_9]|nr:MAG: chromosome segregation protein SMC [Ignavibacteria bacterium GWF2_33_9]
MYLSKLEILGFKSFADKINLNFKDGLSAIVGPNGSGKTNFVDALRWALGEQKTSVLRSESMENVIFNGSKNRKALGLAEVSITIKNSKKILPSEYDEVNISRRLYRDGDSQYLINKVPARLKDITNLLMDTGLGADSYSVIELKMIENLLNGNPAERRDIFEEAAGIKKFKLNKRETTKKLQNVELDLERLNDILNEIQKNVNSLSRQAAKTRRYNSMINELKELEVNLFAFELYSHNANLYKKKEDSEVLLQKISKINQEISEIEKYLNELKVEFNSVDEQFQNISRNEIDLNNQLSQLNTDISLNEEKLNSLENSQQNIQNEIEESKKNLSISENNLVQLNSDIAELQQNEINLNAGFEQIRNEKKSYQDKHQEKEREVSQLNSKVYELKNKVSNINSLISRNAQTKIRTESRIIEEENKLKSFDAQLISQTEDLKNKAEEFAQFAEKVYEDRKKLQEIIAAKDESEKHLAELRNTEFEVKNNINKLNAEVNFLESIVVSDESTKFLLNNKNWKPSDEKVLFGEIISTEEKYQRALYTALENAVSSFLVDDFAKIEEGINELQNSKQGKANFILKSTENPAKDVLNFQNESGIIGLLADLISVNIEYEQIANSLLRNVIITENLSAAHNLHRKLIKQGAGNYKIVTLAGEMIYSSGIISGGGEAASQKTQLIGRRNKIKKLTSEIEKLTNTLNQTQIDFKTEQTKIYNFDIPQKETILRQNEAKLSSIEREKNQLELKLESLKNNFNLIEESISKLKKEIEELNAEDSNFAMNTIKFTDELTETQKLLEFKQQELAIERKNLDDRNEKSKSKEIELVRLQSDIRYKISEIEKVQNSIAETKKRIEDKTNEYDTNKIFRRQLSEKISNGISLKQSLINQLQNTLAEKENIASKRKNRLERVANYEETLDAARKNYSKITDENHAVNLDIASINSKIESIVDITFDQYEIDLNEVNLKDRFTDEERKAFDLSMARTDIALLKEKISLLGNVNFQALEDYEEQKTRLDFLLTQLEDLKNSQKLLQETIEEINKIATEKFLTTIEKIRENFKNLFKVLFGNEGDADLRLEGDSPLDASVYISAKPPFKKPSSIDSLSAGEKTLTAIALLFSIYLVKPSPFCVLDEVDAPLDDSNIEKYIALLRRFSKTHSIQFILITHNKKTMEAADTLYGLTMEEEGVTKVVSVRLEK